MTTRARSGKALGLEVAQAASIVYARSRLQALGRDNRIAAGKSFLGVRFAGNGRGAHVQVGDNSVLRNVRISFWGEGGRIVIGDDVRLPDLHLHVGGNGASIIIGDSTTMEEGGRLDAIEHGARIDIGRDCMFSTNVQLRTSDAHGIFLQDGSRLNPPADVTVGDHVWLGEGALLLKGARIGSGSVVGARSVVTRPSDESSVVLLGSPARVVRRDITWTRSVDG